MCEADGLEQEFGTKLKQMFHFRTSFRCLMNAKVKAVDPKPFDLPMEMGHHIHNKQHYLIIVKQHATWG